MARIEQLAKILGNGKRASRQMTASYMGVSRITVIHWSNGRSKPARVAADLIFFSCLIGERAPWLVNLAAGMPLGVCGFDRCCAILGTYHAARLFGVTRAILDEWDTGTEPPAMRRLAVLLEATQALMPGLLEEVVLSRLK